MNTQPPALPAESETALPVETEEPKRCKNCATPLHGPYCSKCGQADRPLDPRVHDLMHELLHEFVHLDGKIASTLKALIFFPGRLSAEFLAGKRARFIGPVRLYLTMSVLFFLLIAFKAGKSDTGHHAANAKVNIVLDSKNNASDKDDADDKADAKSKDKADSAESAREKWLEGAIRKAIADPKNFRHELMANLSRAMFVLVPLFALALRMTYSNRRFRYPAYVYFSLHYHAFVFLLFSALVAVSFAQIDAADTAMEWMAFLGVPAYLFVALRRTFGGSRRKTLLRMAALGAFYVPCLLVGLIAALCLAVLYV